MRSFTSRRICRSNVSQDKFQNGFPIEELLVDDPSLLVADGVCVRVVVVEIVYLREGVPKRVLRCGEVEEGETVDSLRHTSRKEIKYLVLVESRQFRPGDRVVETGMPGQP